jgi:hypothetical protein
MVKFEDVFGTTLRGRREVQKTAAAAWHLPTAAELVPMREKNRNHLGILWTNVWLLASDKV